MSTRGIRLFIAIQFVCAWWVACIPASAAEFYSVVERDGTVVLCLSKGAILFSDRCAGEGRLTIVEPIKEGAVVWRSATGTVSVENETPNSECAIGRAKWDQKAENVISTGKNIAKADRADLLQRLIKIKMLNKAEVSEGDVTAFALDLDNDGKEEIVFAISNLPRVADLWEHDHKTGHYTLFAGIMPGNSNAPAVFYSDHGDYDGGTDAIGSVTLKGVVSISPGTGEIALLINAGTDFNGNQTLVRYRYGAVQKLETIQFTCN